MVTKSDSIVKDWLKKFIKIYLRDKWWSLYGTKFSNQSISIRPRSLLFICKGNICRSPFAEQIANKLIPSGNNLKNISAGLSVTKSEHSPETAILAAKSFGVDLSMHNSRRVKYDALASIDMAIVMEAQQLIYLKENFHEYADSFYLLPLFDPLYKSKKMGFQTYNIPDPYGKSIEEYHECFFRIKRSVNSLLKQII